MLHPLGADVFTVACTNSIRLEPRTRRCATHTLRRLYSVSIAGAQADGPGHSCELAGAVPQLTIIRSSLPAREIENDPRQLWLTHRLAGRPGRLAQPKETSAHGRELLARTKWWL